MFSQDTIIKNAAWRGASIIGAKVMMFLFVTLAARTLVVDQFGYLLFSLAVCQIVFVLMDSGVSAAVMKMASESPRQTTGYFFSAVNLRVYTLPVGFAALLFVLAIVPLPGQIKWLVLILGVSTATESFSKLYSSLFIAARNLKTDALATFIGRGAFLVIGGAALWFGASLLWVGVAHFLGSLVTYSLLSNNPPILSTPDFSKKSSPDLTMELWQLAWPLALVEIFTVIYFRLDQVIIEYFIGAKEVGYYGGAFRLAEAAMILPAALMIASFPGLVKTAKENNALALKEKSSRLSSFLFCGALIVAGFGFLWAEKLTVLLFGMEFARSGPLFQILMFALILIFPNYLYTQLMVALGRQRRYMVIAGLCALFNVGANIIMVPFWGAKGAAWATVGTEILLLVGSQMTLAKYIGFPRLQRGAIWILLGGASFCGGWVASQLMPFAYAMAIHFALCLAFLAGLLVLIRKENRFL